MNAKPWRIFDELLINKVQEFPYLYNYRMREFRNYAAKQMAWLKIAEEIGSEGNTCQRRWRLIRDSYVRYKRDLESSVGVTFLKREKNPVMDSLSFLDAFVKHRSIKARTEVDETNRTADCDEGLGHENAGTSFSVESDEDSFGSPAVRFSAFVEDGRPVLRRPEYFISEYKEQVAYPMPHRVRRLNASAVDETVAEEDSELECFVRSVLGTLHRFTPKQRALAKVRIQQLLFEMEFGDDHPPSVGADNGNN